MYGHQAQAASVAETSADAADARERCSEFARPARAAAPAQNCGAARCPLRQGESQR